MRLLLALLIALNIADAAENKLRLVRETDSLTPKQQQSKLHAPPGFTVQLFASEPMINKPINMAFDARGRLWVSSTVEYPYAATKDRWSDAQGSFVKDSRDAIKILEDTDGDGRADKVTDFADGLNIPTGVLPWHKPEHKGGCIAWSIPNIWYFADTDGDGKCDKREVLFGPLGYEKDTHGMCSSFRLGLDGWVYATHGFNNTSHLKAKDGSSLDLHSGNVFRFRPDGSRVELWSSGQVNPFGLCWDRYGNLYSADCHSNPITQLIRGAHYPSFGKPHDGLGYAPNMCEHSHGSTGLCGIIYIDGGIWGPEWDDHMFLGNCVTSKVNHDKITFTGSTPKANEQPDFITSDDPWFRPVDLQLGPDNALYIADFYNKIIGHYEVPLDHPGRDKERGRIWRVVKTGAKARQVAVSDGDLAVIQRLRQLEAGPQLRSIPPELEWDPFKIPEDSPRVHVARVLALRNIVPDAKLRSEAFMHVYMTGTTHRNDPVLYHTSLLSIRALLLDSKDLINLLPQPVGSLPSLDYPADMELILLSLPQEDASNWLLKHHTHLTKDEHSQVQRIAHAARFGTPKHLDTALNIATSLPTQSRLEAVQAMHEAMAERGVLADGRILQLAQRLAEELLQDVAETPTPAWTTIGDAQWALQLRKCADGATTRVLSSLNQSLKGPEKLTGILSSKAFTAPDKLSFWLCGHQGFPTTDANKKNLVRLVDGGGAVIKEVFPPRNDIAQRVEWDLAAIKGKPVRFEIVDGDNGTAYAWLGVGRFEQAVLSTETFITAETRQKQLKTLATILRTTAPVGLRDKLAAFLPQPANIPKAKPQPEIDALIKQRIAAFAKAKPDVEIGEGVFKMNCAVCHQIKSEGGLIGPQLDGIGNRGAERLIEDILDTNRNVDAHFRLHQMKLRDGSTATGFVRGEVGQVTILVDAADNEQRISKGDIVEDNDLPQSLMPPTFGQTIPADAFNDMIAWLLKR